MSYQHFVNTDIDKHLQTHVVRSVQQIVTNQASITSASSDRPIDRGEMICGLMTGTAPSAISTSVTTFTSNMSMTKPCPLSLDVKSTAINTPTTFYNRMSNLQSHLRMNSYTNDMTRNSNYATTLRMPGQYGANVLMPHGTKRKQKDPNRPKRPTTAYFYFAQLERESAAKRGERISKVSEWTKQVAEKWRNLDEEARVQFRAMAAEDKTRFDQEDITVVSGDPLSTNKSTLLDCIMMAAYTGKDANKPKRPQSSYFLWLADFRIKMKDRISEHKEILRAAGEEWRKLTLEEKAPYEQMAEEERKKYECRMKEYQEMTKRARVDSRSTSEGFKDSTLASASASQPNIEIQHLRDIQDEMQGNTKDDESTDEDNGDDLYRDEE